MSDYTKRADGKTIDPYHLIATELQRDIGKLKADLAAAEKVVEAMRLGLIRTQCRLECHRRVEPACYRCKALAAYDDWKGANDD